MHRFPPKKILVAFDHSPASKVAWAHALALSRRFGASLEAVLVQPMSPSALDLHGLNLLTPARARELREGARKALGRSVTVHVAEDQTAPRIVKVARRTGAELIVCGTRARSTGMRLLLGSVAEELLRLSPLPVLVARGRPRTPRRLLAPMNFASYSRSGLAFAAQASQALRARLTLLNVEVDPIWSGDPRRRLERLIAGLPPAVRARSGARILRDSDPARGIGRGAAGHDWIVLTVHPGVRLRDVLLGTTAERVIRGSAKPLLAVPETRRASRQARQRRSATSRPRTSGR